MRIKYYFVLFILVGLLSACNTGIEPKEHLGDIYSIALDSIMKEDEGLNSNMQYIAIDMSNFEEVDESDKKEILNYFKEKYKVEVMDATFEQLEEKGLYNSDMMSLDGVLLKIEKVDFKFNNKILFEGSKYRSGLGAIGVEVKVHYQDNKWKAKEVKMTWIS
ncbi:peptide ABC transporter substrate-binding protein [Solibacillus isronensis]|uniref:peptide ABC transporter substrate-binding protein n=1 Tax=Solibacillus isronensis TaxID=412383 RepID=UPI0039A13E85